MSKAQLELIDRISFAGAAAIEGDTWKEFSDVAQLITHRESFERRAVLCFQR